jgi:hypothetical protein
MNSVKMACGSAVLLVLLAIVAYVVFKAFLHA